ncbi:MAM and LDL-receptor class A domain-containing protein 1 [Portunus trituberculatus]|uniref:MAM and LDL-receptor class A domain-containing protein 1 n=1 Tax=Portunus trituberculatus TaxID=210409 RepID=A0A5B7HQM4_PORTR|nr:MAM and LDL-receptor class A domain-containing protein 1 [Portunus trituberculatus]
MCEWTNVNDGGAEWIWNSGQNPDLVNSPPTDHTFGTSYGHYSSFKHSPDNKEDKAYLFSPIYHGNGEVCFQFYFYMQGKPEWSGQLFVYIKSPSASIDGLSPIVFVAMEGEDGENSTIAIDDVVMLSRTCPTIATCSFEDGFCGWTNTMQGDDTEWLMNQGSTPTEGTGPKYDHTLNTALGESFTNLCFYLYWMFFMFTVILLRSKLPVCAVGCSQERN